MLASRVDEEAMSSKEKLLEQFKVNLAYIKSKLGELSSDLSYGVDKVIDHCHNVRTEIELFAEGMLNLIGEMRNALVAEINAYQKECLKKFEKKGNYKIEMTKELDKMREFQYKWTLFLRQLEPDEEQLAKANESALQFRHTLDNEIIKLNEFVFNNKILNFNKNSQSLRENLLGSIEIKIIQKLTLVGHADYVQSLVVLPNNDIATGSSDKTVKIWSAAFGQLKATLNGHRDAVLALAALPDPTELASGSADKTIRIWNIKMARTRIELVGHTGFVNNLIVLPNGELASSSYDYTIRIWDFISGRSRLTLKGHKSFINGLELLPNCELASCSFDYMIKIWNVVSGQLRCTLIGHFDCVRAVRLVNNSELVSVSDDRTIR